MTNTTTLQEEIKQQRPFRSRGQEAALAILRTADVVRRRISETVEPSGVTMQQYNVLRILRGAHPDPLPTYEIAERMLEQTPGITRLLDRLEEKGLVRRSRCTEDRRLVHCRLTDAGLQLLAGMDVVVTGADERVMGGLTQDELKTLIALLAKARGG